MLKPETINMVWIVTDDNQKENLIESLNDQHHNFTPQQMDIILRHYWMVRTDIENTYEKEQNRKPSECPNCQSILKYNPRGFYSCPKWKPNNSGCQGYITSKLERKLPMLSLIGSWVSHLAKELNMENNATLKKRLNLFFKSEGLTTIGNIWSTSKTLLGKPTRNSYQIAKENAAKQEAEVRKELIGTYGVDNVTYHPFICFNYKNSNKVFFRVPDFLVFPDKSKSVLIVECKQTNLDTKEEQRQDYLTLVGLLFPNQNIQFIYRFNRVVNYEYLQ